MNKKKTQKRNALCRYLLFHLIKDRIRILFSFIIINIIVVAVVVVVISYVFVRVELTFEMITDFENKLLFDLNLSRIILLNN